MKISPNMLLAWVHPCWPSLFALALALAPTSPVAAARLPAWVELVGPADQASVRVIVGEHASCPTLRADGEALPMHVRAEPGPLFPNPPRTAEFPVRVCEAIVPQGKASVLLDGASLPLPRGEIQRIVIFGDTGCRIKENKKPQDCKHDWHYDELARRAADTHPDLVIHVGDYLYREVPCKSDATDCETGYGWSGWKADFFEPSAPLFAAAPWIMVRGNHETCSRAAEGWFRFLDHARPPTKCAEMSDFFVADLGGLGFVVIDSAMIAEPNAADPDDDDDDDADIGHIDDPADALSRRYDAVARAIPAPAWILTHVPFNAVRLKHNKTQVADTIQQQTIGQQLSTDVKMIVSGHVHMFEALSFVDAGPPRPPQLVVGTGGVKLAKEPDVPKNINGGHLTEALFLKKFGYMVWDRDGATWKGTLMNRHGEPLAHCKLTERELTCKAS